MSKAGTQASRAGHRKAAARRCRTAAFVELPRQGTAVALDSDALAALAFVVGQVTILAAGVVTLLLRAS